MKLPLLLLACAWGSALAETKEEAQKTLDDALAQSCALTKKSLAAQPAACADELAAMAPVDCANRDSRKSRDFLKLNVACLARLKDEKKKPKDAGTGSGCKLLDEAGAVVLEHDSEGSTLKCQGEIREKVKALKCEPEKKLSYQYVGEGAAGKPGKPIAIKISCPAK